MNYHRMKVNEGSVRKGRRRKMQDFSWEWMREKRRYRDNCIDSAELYSNATTSVVYSMIVDSLLVHEFGRRCRLQHTCTLKYFVKR